jgi:hypothetical protein
MRVRACLWHLFLPEGLFLSVLECVKKLLLRAFCFVFFSPEDPCLLIDASPLLTTKSIPYFVALHTLVVLGHGLR